MKSKWRDNMTYVHLGQVHHMVHFDKQMSLGFIVRPWFCQIYTLVIYLLDHYIC